MIQRPFKQIDVFTATAHLGNPVAVVLDASGLSDEAMQRFARWTNLSETTFVLPPTVAGRQAGADYRVRIFTPGGELPFAGHPTLGTCHAWLEAGGLPHTSEHILQECEAGLVRVRPGDNRLAFAAPPLRRSAVDASLLEAILPALGLHPGQVLAGQMLDNGPHWLGLLLADIDTLNTLEPDHIALKKIGKKVGVASMEYRHTATNLIAKSNHEARAFGRADAAAAQDPQPLEVRAFAAPVGVNEDPVTGSLNASLAQWLIAEGRMPTRYTAHQGSALGREGRIFIEQDALGQVWVGGDTVTCVDGQVLA